MVIDTLRPMTSLEALVFDYLVRHKIEFQFQTSLMGGIYELGGMVVDFLLPERRIALRIMGTYWHKGVVKEGSDLIQREMLANMGWIVVDIWEDDILDPARLNETMRKALQGIEMLR